MEVYTKILNFDREFIILLDISLMYVKKDQEYCKVTESESVIL